MGAIKISLNKRISTKRKEIGLTQEELSNRINVTASFVSQIEKGIKNPSYRLLQKISHELNVPVEYLVGGDIEEFDEPAEKLIASAIRFLDIEQKSKIIEYIYLLTGSRPYHNFPFFDSPTNYAQYILKKYNHNSPPIDPFNIANSLGVKIITSKTQLENEGILFKHDKNPYIILSPLIPSYKPRIKFTLAMLLGHLVIPWHLKSAFYRESDIRSLEIEDQLSIEAREFAGALLLPPSVLRKDLKERTPGLQNFEELAYNKYGCSMLMIAQRFVQYHSKTSVLTTSKEGKFTRVYDSEFPYSLVDDIKKGTFAYSFIDNPPKTKEIRKGMVEPSTWVKSPPLNIKVYEESLLDPEFGVTVTLLLIKK